MGGVHKCTMWRPTWAEYKPVLPNQPAKRLTPILSVEFFSHRCARFQTILGVPPCASISEKRIAALRLMVFDPLAASVKNIFAKFL